MIAASVKWIGHASALVDLGGQRVLIDPLGRRRCRGVGQYGAVLITHAHIDHLNRWTLAALDRSARLLVPKNAARYVADLGFASVTEVEPGDQLAIGRIDVVCVPTRHGAGRWRKGDGPGCTGYLLSRAGTTVHHAGDVDMSTYDVFDAIGRQAAIDVTLLPIGGMLPVWYYRMRKQSVDRGVHIDPDTALHIAQRLGARAMVPIHWGTLHLGLGSTQAPRRRLVRIARQRECSDLIQFLKHGQQLPL